MYFPFPHSYLNNGDAAKRPKRRRESSTYGVLPRAVQFDESADQYRCFCGCFHVKTGAYLIAGESSPSIDSLLSKHYFSGSSSPPFRV